MLEKLITIQQLGNLTIIDSLRAHPPPALAALGPESKSSSASASDNLRDNYVDTTFSVSAFDETSATNDSPSLEDRPRNFCDDSDTSQAKILTPDHSSQSSNETIFQEQCCCC